MSEKKDLKRAVKTVWDQVKTLRTERGKLYAPADIAAAADELKQHAEALRKLSLQLSALNPMPPDEPVAASKAKRAAPRKG